MADDYVTAVPEEAPQATPDTPGETVYVLSPDGKRLNEIPKEKLQENLDNGYKPAPPELVSKVVGESQAREKYESPLAKLETGGEAALQGATFGLGHPIERAFGVKQEDIEQRAERNQAEALGGTAASLFTPGVGAVAGGLGHISEALTGALQLGAGTSKVVKGALTGAALNAAYETGNQVDKAMLGDSDALSSHAIGQIGHAALMGVGVGGGLGLGEAFVSPLLEKLSNKFSKAADDADAAIAKVKEGTADVNDAARDVAKADQATIDHTADFYKKISGARAEEDVNLSGAMPLQDARAVANDYLERANQKLNDIVDDPKLNRHEGLIGEYRDELKRVTTQLENADSSSEIRGILNEHKGVQDAILEPDTTPTGDKKVTGNALKEIRYDSKVTLEDPRWGDAGGRQADYNAAVHENIQATKALKKLGYLDKEGDVSVKKVKQYLKWQATGDVQADAIDEARGRWQESHQELLNQGKQTLENTSQVPYDKEELTNLFEQHKALQGTADTLMGNGVDAAKALNVIPHTGDKSILQHIVEKAGDWAGTAVGGALGHAVLPGVGGIVGAKFGAGAANKAVGALFGEGAQTLVQQQTMARLLRISEQGTKAVQNGVSQFLSGRTAAVGYQALKPIYTPAPSQRDTRGQDAFHKTVASIQDTTPESLATHMASRMAGVMKVAPEVAMQITTKVAGINQYIKQLLPPTYGEGSLLPSKPEYSPSVQQKVNDALLVLTKPQVVPKLMANGELTSDQVTAMKTVHQGAYQDMVSEFITQMAKNPSRKYSIMQEQMLSTLLQQPVSPSFGPDFAQWAQANAIAPEAPPAGPKPSGKKLTLGQESFTQSEKQQSQEG